jgi:hypothetical protein
VSRERRVAAVAGRAARLVGMLVGAAALYAAIAIWWTYPLVTLATTHTAVLHAADRGLVRNDQAYSISAAARNAAAITTGHLARLVDWQVCYPTPHAAALGEHGIELGLLATPGLLATGEPVAAYNLACLLLIVVAGTSAFWLVRYWTGSAVAGLIGGLAFAFHPGLIDDLVHPFVIGIHWLPLVLFALDRLLEDGRARHAVLLAVAGTLQALVGAYPLMASLAFVGAFGVVRLVQRRERLDAGRLMRLAAAAAVVAGVAGLVLVHYVGGGVFGALQRPQFFEPFANLLPGAVHAIGGTALLLGLVALVFRGRRPDPAWAVLAGGIACLLLACGGQLWPDGPVLHPLYRRLTTWLPVLGTVRVPAAIRTGAYLAVALLAGLGVARLLARIGPRPLVRVAMGVVVAALLLTETFDPRIAPLVYRTSRAVDLVERRPDPAVLEAYRAFDRAGLAGPVVEMPFDDDGRGQVFRMPTYILLAAYHGRATPACFTSHVPPPYHEVARMVAELETAPDRGIAELAAAGLRNVVVHHGRFRARADRLAARRGVRTLLRSATMSAFRITRPVSPHHDATRFRLGRVSRGDFGFKGYRLPVVELAVRNAAARVWALPHPVRALHVRWRFVHADGASQWPWHDARTMLPLALAGRDTATIRAVVGRTPRGCGDCAIEVEVPSLGWRATTAAPTAAVSRHSR